MMTKKTKKEPTTAAELFRRVERIVQEGSGAEKRVKEMEALPPKFSRTDGVSFDPRWQDEVIRK